MICQEMDKKKKEVGEIQGKTVSASLKSWH